MTKVSTVYKWETEVAELEKTIDDILANLTTMTNDKINIDELDELEDGYRFAVDCKVSVWFAFLHNE